MDEDLEQQQAETAEPDRTAERELAVFKAGLHRLNDEQRTALLSVVGDDLTTETLTAKATALFPEPTQSATEKPAATPQQQQQAQQVIDGGHAAAAEQAPPPPPGAPIQNVMQKAMSVSNPALLAPGGQLYNEALAAIAATPDLVFGPAEQVGGFEPL